MRATLEDLVAMRALLGGHVGPGETHEACRNLEGADLCVHMLTGTGRSPASVKNSEARQEWTERPYRHHVFVEAVASQEDRVKYPTATPWCACGQMPDNEVHKHCWEGKL